MSEEWRRIQGFRGVSRLSVTVKSEAEIEIREDGRVWGHTHLLPGETYECPHSPVMLPNSFSVWLRSSDPNCQCSLQAQYIDDVTDVPVGVTVVRGPMVDMRFLYGPMGLGIPMAAVSGNPLDYRMVQPSIPDTVRERIRQQERELELDQLLMQKKPQTDKPCPGITRLQAFKRELEEEKPKEKEKHKFLSKLKRKRGEKK